MAIYRVPAIGKNGIVEEAPIGDLPPDNFTYAKNVRFRDGRVELVRGHVKTIDFSGASFSPTFCIHNADHEFRYWLVMSTTKARACPHGVTNTGTDITRTAGDYNTSGDGSFKVSDRWVGDVFGPFTIVTNNMDPPQYWDYPSSSNKLQDLTNWPADTACRSIKVYKNHFVALNITEFTPATNFLPDNYYTSRVYWSHPAETGAVPTTWDVTDTTKDAGWVDLPGGDAIIDGGRLRDAFIIYKQRSTFLMQYVGGQSIFRFTQTFTDSGILTDACFVELDGTHVVLTTTDLIRHDGFTKQSLLDGKMRRWLFKNMDEDQLEKVCLVKNLYFNEIWVCFPISGSTWCDTALCWNWKNGTVSLRDLPDISYANSGPVRDEDLTQTGWDDDEYTNYPIDADLVFMVSSTNQNSYLADASLHFDGAAISAELTREAMTFEQPDIRKLVKSVRPRMEGTGQTVSVQIGSCSTMHGTYSYSSAQTFTINTDFKCDFNQAGRYLALKVTSTSDEWKLESLDIDVEPLGQY